MRLLPVFTVLGLLLGARGSFSGSRASRRLDVRTTSDVCAAINKPLLVTSGRKSVNVGMIDQCLCQSAVLQFVQTNVVAQAAVLLVGQAQVITIVTQMIDDSASESTCTYPDNSVPACTTKNVCGFTCTNGFKASPVNNPTTCACNAPSVICNGQCVAAGLCPSNIPVSKKRSLPGYCSQMGPGWAACGVIGGGPRAWECIKIVSDLESCGGCMYPLTAYSPIGKDCSTIPGVADVSCLGGECAVQRCLPGYLPTPDGTSCIRKHSISQSQFSNPEDVPARVYGLEHVPFGGH